MNCSIKIDRKITSHLPSSLQFLSNNINPIPTSSQPQYAIADSGCSRHFFKTDAPCEHKHITTTNMTVTIPNGDPMISTHEAICPIPTLSKEACTTHIFPDLQSANLISIGQLCDDGCTVTFTEDTMKAYNKQQQLIITAPRDPTTGMWNIPLPIPSVLPNHHIHIANGIIKRDTPINDLINFLHASCFSPTTSTFINAIKAGFLTTWPGLTVKAVRKYLSKSEATTQGHLDQEQQGIQSTRKPIIPPQRTNNIMVSYFNVPTGKIFTDQTGRFPEQSTRGNNYVFVLYDYDSNAILATPIKNRTSTSLVNAFNELTDQLISKGLTPQFQILDNEASIELQKAITNKKISFQLAPPHIHRRNSAERAIRTFKKHFIAGLSSTDPNFPLQLWDRLIPQAVLTLNLLRPSRLNPHLSAQALLHGAFDFNKTPLAPPGTKVQVHLKPDQRPSWSSHSISGWYIGPAPLHYRCFTTYIPSTNRDRISDTVEFFPTRIRMPATSTIDKALQSADDLINILSNPEPASPFLDFGKEQHTALQQLADMFKTSLKYNKIPNSIATTDTTTTPPRSINQIPQQSIPQSTSVPRVPPSEPPPMQLPRVPPSDPPTTQLPRVPTPPTETTTPISTTLPIQTPTSSLPPRRSLRNRKPPSHHKDYVANYIEQHYAQPVLDPVSGRSLEYKHLCKHKDPTIKKTWESAMCNELGRLSQGFKNRVQYTNCLNFISHSEIPSHKRPTYARIVSEIRPQKKEEPHRVRITAGGNLIHYPHDKSQPTADLSTVKLHINSTISTPGAKYLCLDIKNMYLMSQMPDAEYMFIPVDLIPDEFMKEYDLYDKVHNGKIFMKIIKGMYGLPQAGKLAFDQLKAHLQPYGYAPCRLTPGLWKHEHRPISFTLVVDDFGVKYVGEEHAQHLISAIRDAYELHIDWKGSFMLGISLKWDYDNHTVDLSMPSYVKDALHKFQHQHTKKQQHAPFPWTPPTYGAKIQYVESEAPQPLLSTKDTNIIQQIVGTFLYYARAVDCTMLPALNDLGSQQSKPTATTAKLIAQFLDYAATHPDAIIRYSRSDMILHIHSDASYLSAPNSRSRAAGHFFLSSLPSDPKSPHSITPSNNGPVHTVCKTLRNVLASATEAEMGGLFLNCQEAVPLRNALLEMGHKQPATPVQTDNTTAFGIVTSSIRQRRSKSMDMRFHWVQDRVNQGHFLVYWRSGKFNLADYFSKHHPSSHHKLMRGEFLHPAKNSVHFLPLAPVQGCEVPVVLHESFGTNFPVDNREQLFNYSLIS
jgi:hypothetical protein